MRGACWQQVAPDANLRFTGLDAGDDAPVPGDLDYPVFVKPVKGAFSVLARRIEEPDQLRAHMRFGWPERWLIRQLVEPFERVCRARLPQAGSAYRMLLEEPVAPQTAQFNLDGWVQDGRVHALGVVDAVMYPGTQAFMRWEHPSRLAAAVQRRALEVAQRFLGAIGYAHGFFNLEFFYDDHDDCLRVIECNPRLASQFSDLYERVHGVDAHAMALALALGADPQSLPLRRPTARAAASLVYRAFDANGDVPPAPAAPQREALARGFPDALLFSFPKRGARSPATSAGPAATATGSCTWAGATASTCASAVRTPARCLAGRRPTSTMARYQHACTRRRRASPRLASRRSRHPRDERSAVKAGSRDPARRGGPRSLGAEVPETGHGL